MIQFFRILLPSWKFFDGTSEAPELFYRLSSDGKNFGDWILCIPKTGKRSWKHLWVNSRENFLFASHALLEHLKNDLEEGSDPSTSLALVENLVRFQLKESGTHPNQLQFKVAFDISSSNPLYLSPVLEGIK